MSGTADLSEKENALQNLLASQQTVLLSTASATGDPDLSYAPFVRDGAGCFYIIISELAVHTANLSANPRAALMFIRPESETQNLYARERAVFQCQAQVVLLHDERYRVQLTALQNRFGEIVDVLRTLADFHLFALMPKSGSYVAGFGQAYTINPVDGTLSVLIKKHGRTG